MSVPVNVIQAALKKYVERYSIAIVAIALLAIIVRLPSLTNRSIWFDETYSWKLINHFSWLEMVQRTALDVHPPLDYLLSRFLTSWATDTIIGPRILSLTWGVLTVVLVTMLGLSTEPSVYKSRLSIAAWTGILMAVQADHVRWSQEARIYSLMCCLTIASTFILWRLMRNELSSSWLKLCYVLLATMLLYTHNFGLFYVAAQVVFVIGYKYFHLHSDKHIQDGISWSLLLSPFVLYLPWTPILYRQITSVKEDYWIQPVTVSEVLTLVPNHFLSDYEFIPFPDWLCAVITFAVLVVVAYAFFRGELLDKYLATVVLAPVLIAITVSLLLTPVLTARYLLPSSLLFIPLFVRTILRLTIKPLGQIILASMLVLFVWNYANQITTIPERPGMSKICEEILANDFKDQPVVVLRSFLLFEAQYYLRDQLETRKVFAIHDYGKAGFYGGRPLMRPGEVRLPDAMYEFEGPIWVIDSDAWGFGNEAELPPDWKQTERPTMYSPCLLAGWGHIRLREFTR